MLIHTKLMSVYAIIRNRSTCLAYSTVTKQTIQSSERDLISKDSNVKHLKFLSGRIMLQI